MRAALSTLAITVAWSLTALAQQPGRPALERLEQQVQAATAPEIQPGYLGLVADDRQDAGRIRIVELIAGGPAAQAGLQIGDVVVSINRQPMRTMSDMERVMLASPAGTELAFAVERAGEQRDVRVILAPRKPGAAYGRIPSELPAPATVPPRSYLGVRAIEVSGEILRQAGLPSATRGAAVHSVVLGSPAEKANIPPGAVIVGANGEAVSSPADLLNLVARSAPGDSLELSFYDRGQLVRRRVILDPPRSEVIPAPGAAAGVAPGTSAADSPPSIPAAPGATAPTVLKPAPVEPPNAVPAPRIEVLEQRIQQLEQRVKELEQALQRAAPSRT